MPYFGKSSLKKLETCDKKLQVLFKEVVKDFDCTITEGHRGEDRQNSLYDEGKSKLKFPHVKHNGDPSRAVDVCPYPIDYDDRDRFHFFAGFVMSVAMQLGIKIRWGGNWRNNFNTGFKDNSFDDLVHFELLNE